ncbi:MAG: 16S rRNA (cytidine(1402)-2'-O)-methyltransferase [Desulfomonilaceae bacterium]
MIRPKAPKKTLDELKSEAGILFVVATPIGNLEDITIRAVETLRHVNLIACEDTRKSRVLINHWGIPTRLMSLHRFSESRKIEAVLDKLQKGFSVALITDAGTPAVSDPGNRLVRAALRSGFKVSPVPGPSSITTALSVSGMDCSSFLYLGFAPRKESQRKLFFVEIQRQPRTVVFLETATRILDTLKIACEHIGSRKMALFRELTKVFEEIILGDACSILESLESRNSVKGEITVVVEGSAEPGPSVDIEEAVLELMDEGLSGKRLAIEAYIRFGLNKTAVYQKFLEIKNKCKFQSHDPS